MLVDADTAIWSSEELRPESEQVSPLSVELIGVILGPIAATLGIVIFVLRRRVSTFVTREHAEFFPFLRGRLERKRGPIGIAAAALGLVAIGMFFFVYGVTNGFGRA